MRSLIVDNGSTVRGALAAMLATSGFEFDVIGFDKLTLPLASQYTLVVLSGGSGYAIRNHLDYYGNEIDLIRKIDQPIIGICLGFEIIAVAFGARLEKLPKKEKGLIWITPLETDLIFEQQHRFQVWESHRWVVRDPGPHLTALAESEDGVEIVKHPRKPIYGFQFHPEMFPDKSDGSKMFKNLLTALTTRI